MRRDPGALERRTFDVAVIGGGVLGAATAREAALRGLSVALVEKGDFGCEASSNNLRILHGGVRSLSRGRLADAREARARLAEWRSLAPHLVDPLRVAAPTGSRLLPAIAAIVSNLVLGPGSGAVPPRARVAGATEIAGWWPGGPSDAGLPRAALEFDDALAYSPERLVLALVGEAVAAGAVAVNHVAVTGGARRDGRIERLDVHDRAGSGDGALRARLVVNATGAAVSDVAGLLGMPLRGPRLSHSLNVLVGPLGLERAIGIGSGRRYFFVPWRGRTAIGTAHHPVGEHPALDVAVERFVTEAAGAWPGAPISPSDVLDVHAGWVLADSAPGAPVRLSERPWIALGGPLGCPNLVSAVTHKLTSAPAVARRLLAVGLGEAGVRAPVPPDGAPRVAPPRQAPAWEAVARDLAERLAGRAPPDVVAYTIRAYGPPADRVLAEEAAGRHERIVSGAPVVRAHLDWGVAREMAVTVEDLLERRTELGPLGLTDGAALAAARAALARGR